ncbi:MAG: outer membrane protein assembly factor BamD [Candidatus Marinimicrobia bacterium]|nr:outer membrane protein assembly factor BamD [Candidatus Neomarinimicrobiota bacterium]
MSKLFLITLVTFSFFIGACDQRSASQIYSDAETLISQDKFSQALKDLQKIEKKYSENELAPKGIYRMAEIYMNELKDLNSAIETYVRVADMYRESPYGPKSRFMAGFLLANNTSRFDEARNQYKLFLVDYPDNELVSAVDFEMENLGKEIGDIPQLKDLIEPDSEAEAKVEAKGADK